MAEVIKLKKEKEEQKFPEDIEMDRWIQEETVVTDLLTFLGHSTEIPEAMNVAIVANYLVAAVGEDHTKLKSAITDCIKAYYEFN